jgi:ammonia channel protein AmtB
MMSQQQGQSIIKSCPWDQFLDSKRFKIPTHFADVKPRAIANLKENNFNYILISAGILAAGWYVFKSNEHNRSEIEFFN